MRTVPTPALARYLQQLKRRLSLGLTARGLGIGVAAALVMTVAGVFAARAYGFSPWSVAAVRAVLFASVAVVSAWALVRPLAGLRRERWLRHVERADRPFAEQLRAVLDRGHDASEPMVALLAGDTLERATSLPPARLVPSRAIALWAAGALGLLLGLLWMGLRGPGYLGHGTALLWTGWLRTPSAQAVVVEPGSVTLRRRADLLVRAKTAGFFAESARLSVRHAPGGAWETVPMRTRADAEGFEFVLAGVEASLSYRVEAGGTTSPEYEVRVEELPQVRGIKLVYHYPEWTRLPARTEERGGDVRAVAGTIVDVHVETDRPLAAGTLVIEPAAAVPLVAGSTNSRGRLPVEKDGRYFVAALYGREAVRLSDDYLIEVVPDEPPVPSLSHPGRDVRASAIEEVTMAVGAQDDFAVHSLELRYSVNGGAETAVPVATGEASAHTLALERHGLAPGDLVSYYAVARDAKTEARTDLYFIEVTPFDREFSQSQESGGGGGGGGGDEARQIPARQKELIVATWNLSRETRPDPARQKEDAKALAESQSRLQSQAAMLAERMRRRGLADVDKDFQTFVAEMDAASAAMGPAAEELGAARWTRALPHEQEALRHLQRAEAVFRRIQVSRGRQSAAGGAQGGESRDLAEMFELELDTEKNQYETRPPASAAAREVDEVQRRIKDLARRHEEAAGERPRDENARLEQRWEQQVLRREIEELARELQRLQRREEERRRQEQQAQGRSGAAGERTERSAAVEGARRRLEEAARHLQEAERAGRPGEQQSAEAQVRQRLREAQEMLGAPRAGSERRNAERALEGLQRARGRLDPLRAGTAPATPPPGRPGERPSGGDSPEGDGSSRRGEGGGSGGRREDGDRTADTARSLRDALEDVETARRALSDDSELGRAADRLREQLERVIPRAGGRSPGNPELLDRELEGVLRAAEAIETALRRRLDITAGAPVRTQTGPAMPAEHRDAIAEYYRRLSEAQ